MAKRGDQLPMQFSKGSELEVMMYLLEWLSEMLVLAFLEEFLLSSKVSRPFWSLS